MTFSLVQEAENDLKNLAIKNQDTLDDAFQQAEKRKRSQRPDDDLSAARPRRLKFTPKETVDDIHSETQDSGGEDHPHVPTPTSSACEEDSEAEDSDLFKGKFAITKDAKKKNTNKPIRPELGFTTPAPKRSSAATPASDGGASRFSGMSEEIQDMLAGIEDAVLDVLPCTLSRLVSCSHGVFITAFCCCSLSIRDDLPHALTILHAEGINTWQDACECFASPDCCWE